MNFSIPNSVQAAVYRGVNDMRIESVPVPRIRSDELLAKVAVCGVCPADIRRIQYGTVLPRRGEEASVDLGTFGVDEKDLIGSDSAEFMLQQDVARLVFSRKINVRKLVSHEFPLLQTAEAVQLVANPRPDSLKIVIRPA